jgi:hypothetical protein
VEKQANQELERLIPLLNLTPQQQEQVFDRLAQNSLDWHPAFQLTQASNTSSAGPFLSPVGAPAPLTSPTATTITNTDVGSTPVPTPTASGELPDVTLPPQQGVDEILDGLLTDDQEDALAQDTVERQEWWSEMLEVMKANMEQEKPIDKTGEEGNAVLVD